MSDTKVDDRITVPHPSLSADFPAKGTPEDALYGPAATLTFGMLARHIERLQRLAPTGKRIVVAIVPETLADSDLDSMVEQSIHDPQSIGPDGWAYLAGWIKGRNDAAADSIEPCSRPEDCDCHACQEKAREMARAARPHGLRLPALLGERRGPGLRPLFGERRTHIYWQDLSDELEETGRRNCPRGANDVP